MQSKPQKKMKPKRNPDYLKFIREQPSIDTGCIPSDAHHARNLRWGSGTSIKSHDYCTIPVDRPHTADVEKGHSIKSLIIIYMLKYIGKKGYDKFELIDLLIDYIESNRRKK